MNSPRDLPTRLSIVAIGIALGGGNLLAWDKVVDLGESLRLEIRISSQKDDAVQVYGRVIQDQLNRCGADN